MAAGSTASYQRNCSLEDDWIAVKKSPFTESNDSYRLPAVAVDWNSSQAVFNVTLLSISNDGTEERLWSDSFSISKIKRRHFELCLVHPELKDYLPTLPQEFQGIWGYIQWIRVSPKLCKKMEVYITEAFKISGWKLFSSVFFGEPAFFEEDYTIPTLQLKRNKYVREVAQVVQNLEQHLEDKGERETAGERLFEWYEKLNDLLTEVNDAERKLLGFDCEPYEELRDIAQKERTECATMFNHQSLTNSTFQNSAQNFSQWEEQYVDAVQKISVFRITHFKTNSLPRLQEILKIMKDDWSKNISKSNDNRVSVLAVRLAQVEKEIITNETEILNCVHQVKILERDKLRQDAIALDEDLTMEDALNEKEILFYKKQCELFAIECEIQEKNEGIIRLELKSLEDTKNVENTDVRKEVKEKFTQNLSAISRKKALLRNKKKSCEKEIEKMSKREEKKQEKHVAHHGVQMKIERRRGEEQEKKDVRLEERQKTLLRLKEYKKKYAQPKVVKPPRYQPPSTRKKGQNVADSSWISVSLSPPISPIAQKDTASASQAVLPSSKKENGRDTAPDAQRITPGTEQSPKEVQNSSPIVFPSTTFIPPVPPPPPPGLPPPPPPPIPPPVRSGETSSATSLAQAIRGQRQNLNDTSSSAMLNQPSSLSEETVNLDAILLARGRLKKKTSSMPATAKQKAFPSGNDLTRAIQSVKLRRVVNDDKPSDLSPDGAEFLKKALERMNRFTKLSDDEEEDDEDGQEQEW